MNSISYSLDKLVTVEQLAQKMAVSIRTVRGWIYKRVLPFTRFERRVYFHADVVEGLLNRNAISALRSISLPDSKPTGQGGVVAAKGVA